MGNGRTAIAAGAMSSVIVGASVPVTGLLQGYPLLTGQAMRYALLHWRFFEKFVRLSHVKLRVWIGRACTDSSTPLLFRSPALRTVDV